MKSITANNKSNFLLQKGKVVWYGWYDYPNGNKWIVKYGEKFYRIIHDGTANEFFHSHAPEQITEQEAKEILANHTEAWEKARELYGWESLEEYLEKSLGGEP